MSCASVRVMMLFLDRSLITNCSAYLCNSCNVVSYKAVTLVVSLNIEVTESQYTDSNPLQTAQLPDRFLNLFTRR